MKRMSRIPKLYNNAKTCKECEGTCFEYSRNPQDATPCAACNGDGYVLNESIRVDGLYMLKRERKNPKSIFYTMNRAFLFKKVPLSGVTL